VTKPCKHPVESLAEYSYVGASERAEELLADGWKQRRCATCRLLIWVKPTRLGKLLAQEKRLRKEHRRVGILKIKLEVKLAQVRAKVQAEMSA
jgi:hypothetical protein